MEVKTCGVCKKEFPKTLEYFYKKTTKQKLANGDTAVYESLRHSCKKCKAEKQEAQRIKKRCVELNCSIDEYENKWKEAYSYTRLKYKETIGLSQGRRAFLNKKIDNGYVFISLEEYLLDCKKNISKARRKYDYGDVDFIPKNEQQGIKHLTDGYIALCMKKKVNEVPKEILETKRLTILIHRELWKKEI